MTESISKTACRMQMADLDKHILNISGARDILSKAVIQNLWSGYGEIVRYKLSDGKYQALIVKYIKPPSAADHPRGWNTNRSHQRKLNSYQIEKYWYEHYVYQLSPNCKMPECYFSNEQGTEQVLIMEDLDASGFDRRLTPETITLSAAKNCLTCLAKFHAKWIGHKGDGLWEKGTYWYLQTRPDEWAQMNNLHLKDAAKAIDDKLDNTRFMTIVHGDAKLANFCFSDRDDVAAVDFQYVGKGTGMKDVAYFISSCFEEEDCEKLERELLDHYFKKLEAAVDKSVDFQQLKGEWRSLYKYAWADLYRFLDGWSPGHWKMHDYSEKLTSQVLNELKSQ